MNYAVMALRWTGLSAAGRGNELGAYNRAVQRLCLATSWTPILR